LRVRDRGCTFPGCGARWFLQAHHIKHWTPERGPTDLDNMVLTCGFHHRLVHEHRWDVRLEPNGAATWLRPDGTPFQPGVPVPEELPARASPELLELAASSIVDEGVDFDLDLPAFVH
ncbi:MAG: HNH endonuclease signature motif containing protein, partial [Actinomycetota bacterium]